MNKHKMHFILTMESQIQAIPVPHFNKKESLFLKTLLRVKRKIYDNCDLQNKTKVLHS